MALSTIVGRSCAPSRRCCDPAFWVVAALFVLCLAPAGAHPLGAGAGLSASAGLTVGAGLSVLASWLHTAELEESAASRSFWQPTAARSSRASSRHDFRGEVASLESHEAAYRAGVRTNRRLH